MSKYVTTTTKTTIHYTLQYEYKPDGSIDYTKQRFVPTSKTVEISKHEDGRE